jgi:hypothetical protein
MKEIYIMYSMGSAICAYVNYSTALKDVLSTIADLTGEPYTGSTEIDLNTYLDDNCDVASLEALNLYDN